MSSLMEVSRGCDKRVHHLMDAYKAFSVGDVL